MHIFTIYLLLMSNKIWCYSILWIYLPLLTVLKYQTCKEIWTLQMLFVTVREQVDSPKCHEQELWVSLLEWRGPEWRLKATQLMEMFPKFPFACAFVNSRNSWFAKMYREHSGFFFFRMTIINNLSINWWKCFLPLVHWKWAIAWHLCQEAWTALLNWSCTDKNRARVCIHHMFSRIRNFSILYCFFDQDNSYINTQYGQSQSE